MTTDGDDEDAADVAAENPKERGSQTGEEGTETEENQEPEEVTEELPGVSDQEQKNVTVLDRSGEWTEHFEVYMAHDDDAFIVSEHEWFPESEQTEYRKQDIQRVKVDQTHPTLCFITTAAAGEGETLDALRGFRDDALESSFLGRALVQFYYAVSPPIAETIDSHPDSRTTRAVRTLVDGAADLAERRTETGSAAGRAISSVVVTLVYVFGMIVALSGHTVIRTLELLERSRN
ncbi:MAG: CFI-box-CTERM domain-containing protein [Halodesulfurarchaeum sp.]